MNNLYLKFLNVWKFINQKMSVKLNIIIKNKLK